MATEQFNQQPNSFDMGNFLARQQRDIDRLTMAAWSTGRNRADFRAAPREEQAEKVRLWVQEALDAAAERRGIPATMKSVLLLWAYEPKAELLPS